MHYTHASLSYVDWCHIYKDLFFFFVRQQFDLFFNSFFKNNIEINDTLPYYLIPVVNPLYFFSWGESANVSSCLTTLSSSFSIWFMCCLLSFIVIILALAVLFTERKLIAAAQKRLGISFLGRNGWIHLPADLIKFWLKQIQSPQSTFLLSSLGGPVGVILSYLIWLGLGSVFLISDGFTIAANFGDFSVFFYLGYALITTLFFFFIVAGTQSKYATIAGCRLLVVTVSLDVFFMLAWFIYCGHSGGCDIDDIVETNLLLNPACALPPLAIILFFHTLYEAKRAPFDHAEAESELVAGHLVEFGGRTLLFLFICEYIHVFFSVFALSIFVFGGAWEIPLLPFDLYWSFWIILI